MWLKIETTGYTIGAAEVAVDAKAAVEEHCAGYLSDYEVKRVTLIAASPEGGMEPEPR